MLTNESPQKTQLMIPQEFHKVLILYFHQNSNDYGTQEIYELRDFLRPIFCNDEVNLNWLALNLGRAVEWYKTLLKEKKDDLDKRYYKNRLSITS